MGTVAAAATAPRDLRIAEHLRIFALALFVYSMVWLGLGVLFLSLVLGLQPIVIASGSMEPAIRTGDVVLIEALDAPGAAERLGPGMVITFPAGERDSELLVTHRIFSVPEPNLFITKGDANAGPDSDAVAAEDVVGVGRYLVPFVGLPAAWLATGNFLPFLAWLGATAVAHIALWAPQRRSKAERRELAMNWELWDLTLPTATPRARLRPATHAATALAILVVVVGAMLIGPVASDAAFGDPTTNAANDVEAGEWKTVVDLAAGEAHACQVRDDGTAWCWGLNSDGQLGDNTTTDRTAPVQVTGESGTGTFQDAAIAAAGDLFSCAAQTNYTAWCWGDNPDGQLGNGTTTDSSSPVQLP